MLWTLLDKTTKEIEQVYANTKEDAFFVFRNIRQIEDEDIEILDVESEPMYG